MIRSRGVRAGRDRRGSGRGGCRDSAALPAYGVLIDPFPYKDVKTLATPKLCAPEWRTCRWDEYSPKQFNEIVQKMDIFSGVTGSTISDVVLTGGSEPQRLRGNYITTNTFQVLGVPPLLGRGTTPEDVMPGHGEVALLSYRYWQAHFGGSPSVLGRVVSTTNWGTFPAGLI